MGGTGKVRPPYPKYAKMPRTTFTNGEKLSIVAMARERGKNGKSLNSIALSMKIRAKQLRDWAKNSQQLSEAPALGRRNGGKKKEIWQKLRKNYVNGKDRACL